MLPHLALLLLLLVATHTGSMPWWCLVVLLSSALPLAGMLLVLLLRFVALPLLPLLLLGSISPPSHQYCHSWVRRCRQVDPLDAIINEHYW